MALTLSRRSSAVVAIFAAALSWAVTAPAANTPPRSPAAVVDPALRSLHGTVGVIVSGARSTERAVVNAGGTITRELPIIGGYAAKVPANDINLFARVPGVRSVTLDAHMKVMGALGDNNSSSPGDVYKKVVKA